MIRTCCVVCAVTLGAACSGGSSDTGRKLRITSIHSGGDSYALALDETRVYWTESRPTNGGLYSALRDGSDFRVISQTLHDPSGIAVHGGWIYVATLGDGTIQRFPTDGGAPEVLFTGQQTADQIAVDDDRVYWTQLAVGELNGEGQVSAATLDGGAPYVLGLGYQNPAWIAVDDDFVYWAVRGQVAYDPGGLPYFPRGLVYRSPKDGGGPTPLASNLLDLHTVTARNGSLYFAANGDGGGVLVAQDEASGHRSGLLVPYDVWSIAPVDGGFFLAGVANPEFCPELGYLAFYPSDGSPPTDYSVPQWYGDAVDMKVDDTSIFVADPCSGIYRIER